MRMRKKTTRLTSAILLRRRRRHARYHGLRPWMTAVFSPRASSAAVSSVKSVSVPWATTPPESLGAPFSAAPTVNRRRRLLLADRGEVELVQHVVHVAAQVHAGVEEVRELTVHERRPGSLRVGHLVDLGPLVVDGARELRLLLQRLDLRVDGRVVEVGVVVVVR